MMQEIKKMFLELESDVSKILINIETLQYIQVELARICQQMDGKTFDHTTFIHLPNYSTLFVLDELMFYTMKDLMTNYEAVRLHIEKIHAQLEERSS